MNTLNISDKERLELLEESFNHDIKNHNAYSIADYDISWLIEQAERVQELERTTSEYLYSSKYLLEQNKRYREALENIRSVKDDENFNHYAYMMLEIIDWADVALKEESE